MKKYLFVFTLAVFIIPSFVSAAWWNPLSWSKNKNAEVVEPVKTKSRAATEPSEKSTKPAIVEKIVEKPIIQTQTITVQDPALQAQVNSLIAENTSLKAEVEKLLKANKSLNQELTACEDKPTPIQNKCEEAKDVKEEIQERLLEISEICKDKRKKWEIESQYKELKPFVCPEASSSRLLTEKVRSAQADIAFYCEN